MSWSDGIAQIAPSHDGKPRWVERKPEMCLFRTSVRCCLESGLDNQCCLCNTWSEFPVALMAPRKTVFDKGNDQKEEVFVLSTGIVGWGRLWRQSWHAINGDHLKETEFCQIWGGTGNQVEIMHRKIGQGCMDFPKALTVRGRTSSTELWMHRTIILRSFAF